MISDRSFNLAFFVCVSMFAVVFVMGLSGCGASGNKPNVEIIQDMMEQPALKAQDKDQFTGLSAMRVPPEGTLATNREVYLYKGNLEGAIANLSNPNGTGTPSPEVLALGEKHFKNYCYVCHGPAGLGDGPVAAKFGAVKVPALVSDKVMGMKDGQIFHIVTEGQGVMGHYSSHMPFAKDRWAVVSYVRKLQRDIKK